MRQRSLQTPSLLPTTTSPLSAEATADFLHVAMDKLDSSLTDEQKLSVLKIAGGIKPGAIHMHADHGPVDVEFSEKRAGQVGDRHGGGETRPVKGGKVDRVGR